MIKRFYLREKREFSMISPLMAIFMVLALIFLALPVLFTILYSFNDSAYFAFNFSNLSFKWYLNFFSIDYFQHAIIVSLGLAAVIIPLTTLIGMGAAYALVRGEFRGAAVLNAFVLSPIVIPGVVTGIALMTFFGIIGFHWSFGELVLALTITTVAYPIRTITANLHGLNANAEEAAINLGANRWTTFWKVIFPQIGPGILSGCIFIFTMVIEDVSIVIFLVDMNTNTLAIEAMNYMRTMDDPTIAAMSTMLILLTLVMAWVIERFIGIGRFLSLD